jgi:hypothetical protein
MAAKLKVETQLDDLIKGLGALQKQSEDLRRSFEATGKGAGEAVEDQTKKTERFFERMKRSGASVARSIKDDFKALMGLNAIGDSLKISNQFRGAIKEVFELSDGIRKYGTALGIASQDFGKFQSEMIRGLGKIGLSSDVASRSLKGLMGTGVRGQDALIGYSTAAGQLASVSKTQGQEGEISKGMAMVLRAQGKDVNDVSAMSGLATEVNRAYQATGLSPEQILKGMESMFTGLSDDFRKRFSLQSMTQMAATAQVAGPEATAFLEQYMKMSPVARMGLDAQGMKGVIRDDGTLDVDKFGAFAKNIKGRVGGDPQLAAQTLGMSEDAAKGFLRLADSLDRVKEAQTAIQQSTRDLGQDYRNSMGFGEAFRANINRVKSLLASPLSAISEGGSGLMQKLSESDAGAGLVTGGAAAGAAVLAGGGLRALGGLFGKGAIGGLAKGAAVEGLTGRETIPVYVVNAAEIGAGLGGLTGMGGAGGRLAGAAGFLAKGAGVLGAGAAGYALGSAVEPAVSGFLNEKTAGTTSEGFQGNAIERLLFKLDVLTDGMISGTSTKALTEGSKVQVEVVSKDPGIRARAKSDRGEAQ